MQVCDLVKVGMIPRYANMMLKYEDVVGDAEMRSLLTKSTTGLPSVPLNCRVHT